ncbi:tyrosine-type recombinase/integrase [Methanosphaera sp.]
MNTHNKKIEKENQEILEEIFQLKPLKETTKLGYVQIVRNYTYYYNLSMKELLQEAEQEEQEGILLKHRKIRQRLINYMNYLIQKKYTTNTINVYVKKIRSIYKLYYIDLPIMFYPKEKKKTSITDIPTKKHIHEVIQSTNNTKYQAIILFMTSSGQAINEVLSITIQDFINATSEYHHETSILNVMRVLEKQDFTIPLFEMFREKAQVSYYTMCSDEAVKYILKYLKERIISDGIPQSTDLLFAVNKPAVGEFFRRINDRLGYGWVQDTHRFFTPHNLRRFFANALLVANIDSLKIDFMLGHTISTTQGAYFKANPLVVLNEYKKIVNHVTIFEDVSYREIKSSEKQELDELRRERAESRHEIQQIKQTLKQLMHEQY